MWHNSNNSTHDILMVVTAPSKITFHLTFCLQTLAGFLSLIPNLIIIVVLLNSKVLLKSSAIIFGLASGDVVNSIAMLAGGIQRLYYMFDNTVSTNVPIAFCFKTIMHLWILGCLMPSAMYLLIGIDRMLAVLAFRWYFMEVNNRKTWLAVFCTFVGCVLATCLGYVKLALQQPAGDTCSKGCYPHLVLGPAFGSIYYGFAILAGFGSSTLSLIALRLFLVKRRAVQPAIRSVAQMRSLQKLNKEYKSTVATSALVVLDMLLVSVPNSIILRVAADGGRSMADVVGYVFVFISVRAALNVVVHVTMNQDFRRAFARVLLKRRQNSKLASAAVINVDKSKVGGGGGGGGGTVVNFSSKA